MNDAEIRKILAIGGSDPSGGAGVQTDMKTILEHGAYPYTVLTAITAQNSTGVLAHETISARMVSEQIKAVLDDGPVHAVKTGMLSSSENILQVLSLIKNNAISISVIDPVIKASDGTALTSGATIAVLKKRLLPHVFMVVPNIHEAAHLAEIPINSEHDQLEAAKRIHDSGVAWVLIKGGHMHGDMSLDLLYNGKDTYSFKSSRIPGRDVRGTGCIIASAICTNLSLGLQPPDAVDKAKKYVYNKIKTAINLGRGNMQAVFGTLSKEDDTDENRVD